MKSSAGNKKVFSDLHALSKGAAVELCTLLNEALAARGQATLGFAGGNTPKKLYELLASSAYKEAVVWNRIDYFWGDERYVPPHHEQSNYRSVRESFLEPLAIEAARIHPMPTNNTDAGRSAMSYEEKLRGFFAEKVPSFDVLLLGMGNDGHIASLFPGSPALREARWVAVTKAPAHPTTRLSITFPVINASRNIIVLVAGAEKSGMVRSVLDGSGKKAGIPAAMISPRGNLTWYFDHDAVSKCESDQLR